MHDGCGVDGHACSCPSESMRATCAVFTNALKNQKS